MTSKFVTYRNFLRIVAAIVLLFSFWSVFRLADITLFDWGMIFTIVVSWPYKYPKRERRYFDLTAPLMGLCFFGIASLASSTFAFSLDEHLKRAAQLFLAYGVMLLFCYILAKKELLTSTGIITLVAASGAISSFVVILQGQFGILTALVPNTPIGIHEWDRLTGFTEHPIEAGTTAVYSSVTSAGLAFRTRRYIPCLAIISLNALSMNFSASLTANFAFAVGLCAFCVYTKAYAPLFVAFACGAVLVVATLGPRTSGTRLTERIERLVRDADSYNTVLSREDQWRSTIEGTDARTLVFGNGYSIADLPDGIEIHNGILSALFHFGIMGVMSQLAFLWFFVSRLQSSAPTDLKAVLLGCTMAFTSSFLTAPAVARRPLWIPLFLLAVFMSDSRYRVSHSLKVHPLFSPESRLQNSPSLSRQRFGCKG